MPLDASVQPVQYLKTVEVTFAPFGFTVPESVAALVVTPEGSPVTELGLSGAKNDSSEPQRVPKPFVAQSLK